MKVVVIGGGGFIGINLCEALVSQGHAVRVFDRPRAKHTFPSNIARQVEWFEGDFLNSNESFFSAHKNVIWKNPTYKSISSQL